MNPFDLPGPAFLLFYIAVSVVVISGIIIARHQLESTDAPRIDLSDPLFIAFLRGGHSEAMRVAAISLIDRGLLLCNGTRLETAPDAQPRSVRRPLEKALLEKFVSSDDASSMFGDPKLKSTCREYEHTLKKMRLVPDESITLLRTLIFGAAIILLGGVGFAKVIIALERGRTNIAFLIILVIVAIVIAAKLSFPRLTASGKAMLEDIKHLYSGLQGRASLLQPGGATIEPMMLAAVFGVGALAGQGFAYAHTLFPPVTPLSKKVTSVSSSCSGGSSCGSSCGGGGCGGGCGGCGS